MGRLILSLILGLVFTSVSGQNLYEEQILDFAERQAKTIIEQNVDGQVRFAHPQIITMAGGDSLYKLLLVEESSSFMQDGVKYLKAEFKSPGKTVQAGEELHCTIERKLFIDFKGAKAEEATTLLAISSDDGESWSFVDLNRHDETSIKIFFPDFNDKLLAVFKD